MGDAMMAMTHITEYSFEWRDLPLTNDTQVFLNSVRQSFGTSLRRLVLHAQLSNFQFLLPTVDFDGLEELHFHFDYDLESDSEPGKQAKNLTVLRDCVAPFINHFSSSLSSLSIASSSDVDLSGLFSALKKFPLLHKLALQATFNYQQLSDPSGLLNLLTAHAAMLSTVHIKLNPLVTLSEFAQRQSNWDAIAIPLFSDPKTLNSMEGLVLPPFSLLTHSSFYECVRRSADTLTSLCLVDCRLSYDELVTVVSIFAHRPLDRSLQYLQVEVQESTSHCMVFDVLAVNLPGLATLHVVFQDLPFVVIQWPNTGVFEIVRLLVGIYNLLMNVHHSYSARHFCHRNEQKKIPTLEFIRLGYLAR